MADEDLKFGIKVEINADDIKRQSKDIESSLENTFTNLAENIQREMNSIGGDTNKILEQISQDLQHLIGNLNFFIDESLTGTRELKKAISDIGDTQVTTTKKSSESIQKVNQEHSRKMRMQYEEDLGFLGNASLSAMGMFSKVGGAFGIGLTTGAVMNTISNTAQTAQDVRGIGTSTQSFTKFQQAAKQEGISEQESGAFITQMSEMMQSALSANPAVNQSARAKMSTTYQLFDNNPTLDPRTHNFFLGYDPVQYQKLIYDASIKKSQDDQAKGLSTTPSQAMAKVETDVLGFIPRTQVEKYARPDFFQKYDKAPGINNIDADKMLEEQQKFDSIVAKFKNGFIHTIVGFSDMFSMLTDIVTSPKTWKSKLKEFTDKNPNYFNVPNPSPVQIVKNLLHGDPIQYDPKYKPKTNIEQPIQTNEISNIKHEYDFVKDDKRIAFAQMIKESSGNPNMIGGAGEIGLFQVKPDTMKMMYNMGLIDKKYSDQEMKDPKIGKYLRDQYMELAKKATLQSLGYSGLSDKELKNRGLLEQVELGTLERYNAGTNAKRIPYQSMEYANTIMGNAKATNSAVTINNNINVHGSMTKQDIDYLQQQLGTSNQKAIYMAQRAGII